MFDLSWSSWGASVIGPSHAKNGIPNQDFWVVRRFKWGNVVVVSDGLGSKPHSDHGSKSACFAVIDAAKSYHANPEADIVDILRLIHANWLVRIAPFSSSDCSSTCLFAIQLADVITLGRLGDGMIAFCGASLKSSFILDEKKQDSFSNYTNSLQREFQPELWETIRVEGAECKAIVLCTDGISDDLLPEKRMDFAQSLYSSYADMEAAKRKSDLNRWLNRWPVPGHTDDKTIAGLFRKEGHR